MANSICGPEVLFETCVALKFVDDDVDDDVSMDRCFCSQPQTMNYSVESCPLTNDPLLQYILLTIICSLGREML